MSNSDWQKSLRGGNLPRTARQNGWKPNRTPSEYTPPSVVRASMKPRPAMSVSPTETIKRPKVEAHDDAPTRLSPMPPGPSELRNQHGEIIHGKGTADSPFQIPNAKEDRHAIHKFPDALYDRMPEDVRASVKAVPDIKNKMTKSDGKYVLPADKQKQGPYDDFHKSLTAESGQDPIFKGRPRQVTPRLLNEMREQDQARGKPAERIFGLTDSQVRILPRDETVLIDGQYYASRHTHREFGQGPDKAVDAAGTIKGGQFNSRTGHYNVHQDEADTRRAHRQEIHEQLQYATDKTLPSLPRHFNTRALNYKETEHAKTPVDKEIPKRK